MGVWGLDVLEFKEQGFWVKGKLVATAQEDLGSAFLSVEYLRNSGS